jgi:hypothetical protein
MADVFLSYSSKDRAAAARVQQALARRDLDVFWDQETPPGMDWDTWARGKLADAKVAIVLWSKNSVASDSVRHEAMLARKANKLLPALIDNLTPEDLPMGLYMVQSVVMSDWADPGSKGMNLLIAETEARLGRKGAAARAERITRRVAGKRRSSVLPVLGGLAFVAVAAAAAFWLGQQGNGRTSDAATAPDEEARIFAAATTCDGLNAYVSSYPEGKFKADADARISKECAPAATTTTASATKPKAETPSAPPPDPCARAKTEWAKISATDDMSVLSSFISGAAKSCATQRNQAQARLDTLQAAENDRKRTAWNGVPEFDGSWVLDTSVPNVSCGNFPWRHQPNGARIRRIYGNNDYRDMKVLGASPPTIGVLENNKGRAIVEADGRMRIENKDGYLDCYLKRQ